jgi:peptidyl-prolyl cis-trans isomerase C
MDRGPRLTAELVGVALLLGACGHKKSTEQVVATVAGQSISQSLFDYYLTKKTKASPDNVDTKLRQALLDELISLEAAAASAPEDPNLEQEVQLSRLYTLANGAARSAGVFTEPTEAEVLAAYRAYLVSVAKKEYHVAHVLVATEAQANRVIQELGRGVEFELVAAKESADESRTRSGDLGWLDAERVPQSLYAAARLLSVGEYTKTPVHSKYGWHVVRLIAVRDAVVPSLESVRAQLAVNITQGRYQAFVEGAVRMASVQRN